jgi:predicted dehydrogenase
MSKDKLGIGVIGAGGRGTMAAHWVKSHRASVVAAADNRSAGFQELARASGADTFEKLDDYRKLLERKDVDAVFVASPDWLHEEHATAALAAGKHVYCEKPLAITVAGCDHILRTAKNTGKKLMVGFNMRHMNFTRVMKEIVDSGAIGRLKAAWCRHFVGFGGKFYFHDWHADKAKSGSLLLQKGSHDIDVMHWIAGSYAKRVTGFGTNSFYGGDKPNDLVCAECLERETCTERTSPGIRRDRQLCCFRREVSVEDNQMILMQLENGVQACYLQCHFTPDYFRNYTFIGTEGRVENVRVESEATAESVGESLVRVWTRKSGSWREYANRSYHVKSAAGEGHGGSDARICMDFLDYVLDDKPPISPAVAGRFSVAVGCMGAESIAEGGTPKEIPALPDELRDLKDHSTV